MRVRTVGAAASILLCASTACSSSPPAVDPLFNGANSWGAAPPADATILSPDELRRRIDAGTTVVVTPATLAALRAARLQQYQADLDFLRGLPSPSPSVQALLQEAATQTGAEGDRPVTWPDGGTVQLLGLGTQLRGAAFAAQKSADVGNALSSYGVAFSLLPPALQSQLPSPDALNGKSVGEVKQAIDQLDSLVGSTDGGLPPAPSDRTGSFQVAGPGEMTDAGVSLPELYPGNGSETDGSCVSKGYVAQYWFPLKYFLTPVKRQGMRGTCWAFASIGALESREAVQNGTFPSLSVQFWVNKVKRDWGASDDDDGYWSEQALHDGASRSQTLPPEGAWTYNPASNRPAVKAGDSSSYAHACQGYTGDCSETAHESTKGCAQFLGIWVCGYEEVTFHGPGPLPGEAIQLWSNGETFDLNLLRIYLGNGHALMAALPVYRGFDEAQGGVVSNYDATHQVGNDYVSGSRGGHEVLIVGFLSNADLGLSVGGGGYFIIKNSWGCGAGDGGFYYVPADYVSRYFQKISAVNFDRRRSAAWNTEQSTPGGTVPPTITIQAPHAYQFLRLTYDLATLFSITHPTAQSVSLTVTSDMDGVLFSGGWAVGSTQLPPSLQKAFTTPGTRTLTLTASYGTAQAQATLEITVSVNLASVSVLTNGDAVMGQPYLVSAVIDDTNEADPSTLCPSTAWQVSAPDVVSGSPGCQASVTFGTTGPRVVSVSYTDSYGEHASGSATITVQPAPTNPYPVVTGGGMDSRESVQLPVGGRICSTIQVASGATIDLKDQGCTATGLPPYPTRYVAEVTVDNPANEELTYSWTLYFDGGSGESPLLTAPFSSSTSFDVSSTGDLSFTGTCRAVVTVNAPDPSRSKTVTVWSGPCVRHAVLQ